MGCGRRRISRFTRKKEFKELQEFRSRVILNSGNSSNSF
jgi:hypothetical protein